MSAAELRSTDQWRTSLLRAAECGSNTLRDTWATIPPEQQHDLAFEHYKCRFIAMAADVRDEGRSSANG
jgi:hypothetical protein